MTVQLFCGDCLEIMPTIGKVEMNTYPLKLVDYGFVYHRDKWPQDDITWFLMEKK